MSEYQFLKVEKADGVKVHHIQARSILYPSVNWEAACEDSEPEGPHIRH